MTVTPRARDDSPPTARLSTAALGFGLGKEPVDVLDSLLKRVDFLFDQVDFAPNGRGGPPGDHSGRRAQVRLPGRRRLACHNLIGLNALQFGPKPAPAGEQGAARRCVGIALPCSQSSPLLTKFLDGAFHGGTLVQRARRKTCLGDQRVSLDLL